MLSASATRPLSELRNRHAGQDIWLIAAGKSLDYVEPAFFANKVTVGLNHAYCRFRTMYLVVRDHNFFEDVYRASAKQGATLIAARFGFLGPHKRIENIPEGAVTQPFYAFDVNWEGPAGLHLARLGTDVMIAGMSSITTAMHVCAYLGAANIILCGVDGGRLDDRKYFDGYRDGSTPNVPDAHFDGWLKNAETQIVQVRERLQQVYGCGIVSLNPFINFGLEGHRYQNVCSVG